MGILIGIEKWKAKLEEVKSKKTEVLNPNLSSISFEKRIEYCNIMIDNIENNKSNHLSFGGGKK